MSASETIYRAIASIRLIDPHTHINPHAAASNTLADLLGYHYYTELAHSAGMPKSQIEEDGLPPRDLVHRLVSNLSPIENTAQYRWLVEICRKFFGFEGDRLDLSNWEQVYDAAESKMRSDQWAQSVLDQSNVEAVFLTNDFDDPLSGFDTSTYIPCLRTDDLVFHLVKPETRRRLTGCTGIELDGSLFNLRAALKQRFEHFVSNGARACAISLPPTFEPTVVSDGRAATALSEVLRKGIGCDASHQAALSKHVFWTLAELCDEFGLPFDLMIGVNRGVYGDGVYQGQDLYDSRVSLIQYRELFNAFPKVRFPISVLASVTNQELVSYAWIFPNVITNGHWWYSNTPSFIARDAAARLEAVPRTKQIAYYSDAYKLEFVWPKFDMYRRILANILADHFVIGCGWDEERAIELGRQVLRDNVDEIFPKPTWSQNDGDVDPLAETWSDESPSDDDPHSTWQGTAVAGTSTSLAAGAIGNVEVQDSESSGNSTVIEEGLPQEPADADEPLPDFPTKIDDTVRIDEQTASQPGPGQPTVQNQELDPLPTADEVEAVDVRDVELRDHAASNRGDAGNLGTQLDPEPLDVGDVTDGDAASRQSDGGESGGDQIQPLRGESSFSVDEESLKLQPDPVTGELTMSPPPDDAGSSDVAETVEDIAPDADESSDKR